MTEVTRKPVDVPENSSWADCIGIFKTMDKMMGSAFHAKVQAMSIARKRYFEEHGKNAGFVKKFAEDAGCSYQYAREINQIEQSFVGRGLQNFSKHAAKLLLSLPQEDREEFLEEHKDEPVTLADVKEFKERTQPPKPEPVVTTYEYIEEDEDEEVETIEATPQQPPQPTERYQQPLKPTFNGYISSFMLSFEVLPEKEFSQDDVIEGVLRDIVEKAKSNPKLASLCKARAESILSSRSMMERLYERLEDALQDPIFNTQRMN